MKSRRMRWVEHVTGTAKRKAYSILVGKPEGEDHSESVGVDGR